MSSSSAFGMHPNDSGTADRSGGGHEKESRAGVQAWRGLEAVRVHWLPWHRRDKRDGGEQDRNGNAVQIGSANKSDGMDVAEERDSWVSSHSLLSVFCMLCTL